MRKLFVAFAVLAGSLSLVGVSPASADGTCRIASPQINNVNVCAKVVRSWDGNRWLYVSSLQVKKPACNGCPVSGAGLYLNDPSTGNWYVTIVRCSYTATSAGVCTHTDPSPVTVSRAKVVYSSWPNQDVSYGWAPFPPV